jgi:hypothetical protein
MSVAELRDEIWTQTKIDQPVPQNTRLETAWAVECNLSMEQQATTRTVARLPRCHASLACRSNVLYCWCGTDTQEARFLRISPSGEVEALPVSFSGADWTTVACSSDGNAIFIGTEDGKILKKTPVWGDAAPEPLLSSQPDGVGQLRVCQEG